MTMVQPSVRVRIPAPLWLGLAATVALTLSSFAAGAARNRGGILDELGVSFLSFGHSRGLASVVYWIALFLLVFAWALLGRELVDKQSAPRRVRKHIIVWVAPLLLAGPLASRDVYSYLMQGAMLRDGFDPYNDGAAVNPGPYLLEVSHDWRNTTTPYGPLHLWTGEIITTIVGDNVTAGIIAYKLLSVLGFAGIVYAIPRIARILGGNPALALWLGAANPVMILHLIGGMHNESVMVGLVSIGLLLALRKRFIFGIALIAVAVSLKATAGIALPFVVWMILRHYTALSDPLWKRIVGLGVAGIVAVVETVAVIAAVTMASGSSWGWLTEITGNSKVVNPLAAPTLLTDVLVGGVLGLADVSLTYNQVLSLTRSVGSLLMLAGLVIAWLVFRKTQRAAVHGIVTAYSVAFVANSVTLPWYYASLISLVGVARPPMWVWKFATGASVFIALGFAAGGNHQFYNLVWVLATAAFAWALTVLVFPLGARISYPAPTESAATDSTAIGSTPTGSTKPMPAHAE
nr:alpha-(1->6)-mannopyranosyltransferase A [Corynebacterium sp.]